MKTKHWILLFSLFALLCALLSLIFAFWGAPAQWVRVYSDGVLVQQINLGKDGEYLIENGEEWNLLTVSRGKIQVSSASCQGQDCVHHPPADHGAPIVCLPNRLVLEFSSGETQDAFLR